jgi:hypothetical protein
MADPTFPPGFPEEFKQQVLEAITQSRMEIEDFQHGVATFLNSMDKEQLLAFKKVVNYFGKTVDGDTSTIAYFEGVTTGLLHARHSICLGCENDHEELMRNAGMRETEPVYSPPMDGGNPYEPAPDTPNLAIGEVGMLSDFQLRKMEEYGLDDLRSSDDGRLIGFICVNCKTQYPSITDRMLRPPDKSGCGGCVQKEKWG